MGWCGRRTPDPVSYTHLDVYKRQALAFLLASLVWPESGWALAVMILSAWLIAASVIDLDHQWLPDVFTQGVLWTGLIAAWAQQSPLTLQDAVTGVLVGFITFYSLRWIAGIVLRKEALGMGDVLLFAALGGWVGACLLYTSQRIVSDRPCNCWPQGSSSAWYRRTTQTPAHPTAQGISGRFSIYRLYRTALLPRQ